MLQRAHLRIGALAAAGALLLALAPQPAAAQGGFAFGGRGGGGALSLLRIPEVQKELKIDVAQKELLKALGDSQRAKGRELFQSLRNLSREQRTQKLVQFRAEEQKQINGILNKKQHGRLAQLQLQRAGYSALTQPAIQSKL